MSSWELQRVNWVEDDTEGRVLTKEIGISCCFWRVFALAQKEDLKPERVCKSHILTTSMRVTVKQTLTAPP